MGAQKEYFAQLIVMHTVERTGEIRAWATKLGGQSGTISRLLRDALERGWPAVKAELEEQHGALTPGEHWSGMVASVPRADRAEWIKKNPMPKATKRAPRRTSPVAV